MINRNFYFFFFLLVSNFLVAQDGRYGLSFANEQVNGNTLCIDIQMQFKAAGKLGSSNLVMKYNKTMLANPVYSTENLPTSKYYTSTVTNPLDSLASFNIELLSENDGILITQAPIKTTIGRLCFDVLAGMDAAYLDWQIKNTEGTVVYLDDESTKLKRGKIEVFCKDAGLACDDGDPNTTNDQYDVNCLCAGKQMACTDDTNLNQYGIPTRTYKSRMKINAVGVVRTNAKVAFKAAQSVTLGVGFHAEEGSDFLAMIEDCVDNLLPSTTVSNENRAFEKLVSTTLLENFDLTIAPNPLTNSAHITYNLPNPEKINLSIYSLQGQLVQTLFVGQQIGGRHLIDWQATDLPKGMYLLSMTTPQHQAIQKIIIQ